MIYLGEAPDPHTFEHPYGPQSADAVINAAGLARLVMQYRLALSDRQTVLPADIQELDAVEHTQAVVDYQRDRAVINSYGLKQAPAPERYLSGLVVVVETTEDMPATDSSGNPVFPPRPQPSPMDDTLPPDSELASAAEAWIEIKREVDGHAEPIPLTELQRRVAACALTYALDTAAEEWQRREVLEISAAYGVGEVQPLALSLAFNES